MISPGNIGDVTYTHRLLGLLQYSTLMEYNPDIRLILIEQHHILVTDVLVIGGSILAIVFCTAGFTSVSSFNHSYASSCTFWM